MSAEHRRRYRLGSGITVEFVFRPDQARKGEVSTVALACEWDQAPPRFRPGNARNKFLRAYRRARADFLEDVAQLIGGTLEALLWTVMHSGGAPGERQLRGILASDGNQLPPVHCQLSTG